MGETAMRKFLILACLTIPAVPAVAEPWSIPDGCFPVVTIQSEGCYVRYVVSCPGMDDASTVVLAKGKDGTLIATAFDKDGATMFTGPEGAGMLLEDRTDLFSVSRLKEAGADDFDYTMARKDGSEVRFAGTATLTGETVEIDGRSLQVLATRQAATPAGAATVESEITALFDRELGMVITAEARDAATGKVVLQRRPVEFLFPGEDGALATEPSIGCEG